MTFDPHQYGKAIAALIGPEIPALDAGRPDRARLPELEAATLDHLFAHTAVRDEEMARACISGLWLYHNFLDRSHTISQSIGSQTGSFWHGIMHRREGDFGNARYWFNRVGCHPAFASLYEQVHALLAEAPPRLQQLVEEKSWDPYLFIDMCAQADAESEPILRRVALCEWQVLFDYSYHHATGGGR